MEPFTFSQYSFTPTDNDLLVLDMANPSEKNSPLTSTSPGLTMQRSMPFQVKKEPMLAKSDDNNSLSPLSPMMILHQPGSNPSPTTPPQHFGILMPQAIPAPMAQRLPWQLDPYALNHFSPVISPPQELTILNPSPKSSFSPPQQSTSPNIPVMPMGSVSQLSSVAQPAIMYRNLFHLVECQLPLTDGMSNYDGYRIFIEDTVGYAGNAKIFKKTPDKGEHALTLECRVLDLNRQELFQCSSCREYFENRMYFKANPHIKGRIVLVKNNNLIKVENGSFKVNMKYMCCCKHHAVSSYTLSLTLSDNLSNNVVASALFPIYVKQWRKSTQKKQSCTIMFS
jgi:hypothetical protein